MQPIGDIKPIVDKSHRTGIETCIDDTVYSAKSLAQFLYQQWLFKTQRRLWYNFVIIIISSYLVIILGIVFGNHQASFQKYHISKWSKLLQIALKLYYTMWEPVYQKIFIIKKGRVITNWSNVQISAIIWFQKCSISLQETRYWS